jgi:predicted dehydrogenase
MMKTYKVGIVGLGWAAGAHLRTFAALPNYEPVAVMSRRKLDPEEIRREYGVNVTVYNDYDRFLAHEGMEIVDVCTPHPFHPDATVKAANAGKHLIVEKPLSLTFEDSKRMLEAVKKNRVKTSVGFWIRLMSVTKAMKSIIDKGLIGDIYYAECDYFHGIGPWYGQFAWNIKKDMGGSSLLTAGCHSLDILLYLLGEGVEEVFSYSTKNPNPVYSPYEYDTTSITLLKFEKKGLLGKVASVTDCMQPYVFNMNVIGSDGSIDNERFYSKKIDGLLDWSTLDVMRVDSGDVAHHSYNEQFKHFADCLDTGKEAVNSLEAAYETHRVIFAADRSAETGKPVRLTEFK